VNEFLLRSLTGAIYVTLTLLAAWAGPFTTMLLFLPVCLMAAREMRKLVLETDDETVDIWGMLLTAALYLGVSMITYDENWGGMEVLALLFLLLLISSIWLLFRGTPRPEQVLGAYFTLLLLVGIPFGMLTHLFVHGSGQFIGFMVILWTNDTGAYLVGRAIGRHKLLEAVSPGKTVEGFIGGVALSLVVAYFLAAQLPFMPLAHWLAVGAIISITATLGDLLESAFKRARGVKDSGTLLPGHGGLLDRFDGLLLAAPAVVLYMHLVGLG
jgi:phosphatidate cytidylyltransferase